MRDRLWSRLYHRGRFFCQRLGGVTRRQSFFLNPRTFRHGCYRLQSNPRCQRRQPPSPQFRWARSSLHQRLPPAGPRWASFASSVARRQLSFSSLSTSASTPWSLFSSLAHPAHLRFRSRDSPPLRAPPSPAPVQCLSEKSWNLQFAACCNCRV